MKNPHVKFVMKMLVVAAFLVLNWFCSWGQISITTLGTALTENFNSLSSSGTSSTVPAGWAFYETGSNANTTYNVSTGSSTTGDTYSLGAASATDRAFGGLLSSSLVPHMRQLNLFSSC